MIPSIMKNKVHFLIVLLIIFSSSVSASEIFFYQTDHLGSPVAITDSDGDVVWSSDYKPFGETINEQGEGDLKYNVKELDNTELYYYGARYYDANTGRFITPDPVKGRINDPQTFNSYAYTRNNPLKYIDPDGRDFWFGYRPSKPGVIQHAFAIFGDDKSGYYFASFGPVEDPIKVIKRATEKGNWFTKKIRGALAIKNAVITGIPGNAELERYDTFQEARLAVYGKRNSEGLKQGGKIDYGESKLLRFETGEESTQKMLAEAKGMKAGMASGDQKYALFPGLTDTLNEFNPSKSTENCLSFVCNIGEAGGADIGTTWSSGNPLDPTNNWNPDWAYQTLTNKREGVNAWKQGIKGAGKWVSNTALGEAHASQ